MDLISWVWIYNDVYWFVKLCLRKIEKDILIHLLMIWTFEKQNCSSIILQKWKIGSTWMKSIKEKYKKIIKDIIMYLLGRTGNLKRKSVLHYSLLMPKTTTWDLKMLIVKLSYLHQSETVKTILYILLELVIDGDRKTNNPQHIKHLD